MDVFVWLKGLCQLCQTVIVFQKAKLLFAPGKAANAVATSGLEMSQTID
jgi:glutamate dehydrogenase/leucine dehydrogenase